MQHVQEGGIVEKILWAPYSDWNRRHFPSDDELAKKVRCSVADLEAALEGDAELRKIHDLLELRRP